MDFDTQANMASLVWEAAMEETKRRFLNKFERWLAAAAPQIRQCQRDEERMEYEGCPNAIT
jgi:hypothetical protein